MLRFASELLFWFWYNHWKYSNSIFWFHAVEIRHCSHVVVIWCIFLLYFCLEMWPRSRLGEFAVYLLTSAFLLLVPACFGLAFLTIHAPNKIGNWMERLMVSYMNVNEAELIVRKQEQMFMGFPYCNFSKHTWYLANAIFRDIYIRFECILLSSGYLGNWL